ncbi:helix-turn-helix transcriptional regulator [Chitinophaga sp. OAE865]|uniref:helix-turn-helix domain-containing protein n=1 Tax=Chitinophaga sp. OAE865 TaxID=2817898 RepID=UPI001AEB602F
MIQLQTIEDFYKERFESIPDSFKAEIGHFNVFKFDSVEGCGLKPIPYNIRAYFKICLIAGRNQVHYSDKNFNIEKQALLFSNPRVPYNWKHITEEQRGHFCIFTANFFHHFGNPEDYSVFKPDGMPVIELSDEQAHKAAQLFEDMYTDWISDYAYKYDRMRVLVYELIHLAVKAQPIKSAERRLSSASEKIARQFIELLEQQFPIDDGNAPMRLRSSSDFAKRLLIHVNHLNKVSQEVLHKPTSVIIQERILLEAKILLKHTDKAVSEIAFALGFKEKTHFNNFFKKYTQLTPTQFRSI